MKKLSVFIIIVFLALGNVQALGAEKTKPELKFPKKIKFKLLKNNRVMASCIFIYNKKTDKKGISQLKMTNFEGLGINSRQWLTTYIFAENSSIYADFIMEDNTPVSEIRLIKNGRRFDGKIGKIFQYKDLKSDDALETELFAEHTVIDLLSMLFVTSRRVATGKKGTEKYNFLIDKSTKIVDMMPMEDETAPFNGKEVPVHVLAFAYQNQEIFRVRIFKDSDGYCFPVSISIVTDFTGKAQPVELRADRVSK